MANQETYLTKEGLLRLREENTFLRSTRRQEIADHIQQAKEIGGTADNAEYEQAKEELATVERRIRIIDGLIRSAVLIPDHQESGSDVVEVGSIVEVELAGSKEIRTYTIVGSTEAAPESGRISNESPVGKALLGKRAGALIELNVPSGMQKIKLRKVQ